MGFDTLGFRAEVSGVRLKSILYEPAELYQEDPQLGCKSIHTWVVHLDSCPIHVGGIHVGRSIAQYQSLTHFE